MEYGPDGGRPWWFLKDHKCVRLVFGPSRLNGGLPGGSSRDAGMGVPGPLWWWQRFSSRWRVCDPFVQKSADTLPGSDTHLSRLSLKLRQQHFHPVTLQHWGGLAQPQHSHLCALS